jgi:hypothetical protein
VSLANLSDLETAVAEWLYRTGDTALVARAADFVTLFEADFQIDPDMRAEDMELVGTYAISSASVALPSGDLDTRRVQVLGTGGAQNQPLTYVTPERAAVIDTTTQPDGTAKSYTILGGNIVILPQIWAPIGSTLQVVYSGFTPLSASPSNVNWLLTKFPNLYLYGSLMQAAAYLDDNNANTAKWKTLRDEAMMKLALTIKRQKHAGSSLAVTPSAGFMT